MTIVPRPALAAGPTLDTASDQTSALAMEDYIADHIHYGQVHEQQYNTAEHIRGDINHIEGADDSALYTGNYLGGEAFRYALAKRKISRGINPTFWAQQRDEAKARVAAMVQQFHLLINAAKYWDTHLNPHLNQDRGPTDNGYIDFGGGVFPGKPGLLFRACTPDNAPPEISLKNSTSSRLVGPLHWVNDGKGPADGDYWCLDATSRDAYAGTTFGLATAFDLVAGDDKVMQGTIRDDLIAMTSYAMQYLWWEPRPHGRVVIPEIFGGNDLDNFISPLFVYTPVAQMNMVQVARHAAAVAGTALQKRYWDTVWHEEVAVNAPHLTYSMELDASQPHDSYYKFHLNYLTLFNLIRLEPDKNIREIFRRAMGVTDATIGDDPNALYSAFTYAFTGETRRLREGIDAHRQWLQYKANLDASGNTTINSTKCGHTITCVPRMSTEMYIPGLPNPFTIPEQPPGTGEIRARTALPVAERRGQDFLWQKDPTLLDEHQSPNWEPPGADFLLPYWMMRYYSEVARPKLSPLPAWLGPYFD
jgi:hypothetical protein